MGTLWIGVDRLQVVRADLRAAHPVRFAAGLARLVSLEVLMETAPVPGGARLPASIEVRTEVSILGVNLRRHNHFAYTAFEPAPGAHIIPQACP